LATIVLGKEFLGALQGRPDLELWLCDFDYRVYTTSRGVNNGERLPIARVGGGSLADHRAQALSRSQAGDTLIGPGAPVNNCRWASTLGSGPQA
jgi:hypothetical protein